MKPRCLPLWLLRDVPAFLGVMISFWPLMILVIRNGLAAMRGKPIPRSAFEKLPHLLAHAESWLDFAILREAYRRLGWNPRSITFALHDSPETWPETEARFHRYQRIRRDPEAYARACADDLRAQYGISRRALAAHGSTAAAFHAAAHHEGNALGKTRTLLTLMVSSAPCARPSTCRAEAARRRNHEGQQRAPPGAIAHARGPPLTPYISVIDPIRNSALRASEAAPLHPYTNKVPRDHILATCLIAAPHSPPARSGTPCASTAFGLLNVL